MKHAAPGTQSKRTLHEAHLYNFAQINPISARLIAPIGDNDFAHLDE